MIQIKQAGIVGIRLNGRTIGKSRDDGPFSLDKKAEAELVESGEAEYVGGSKPQKPQKPKKLEKMNKQELEELAKSLGITLESDLTQKQMVAAIKTAQESESNGLEETDEGKESENGQSAVTGDLNPQSDEIAQKTEETDPETVENGAESDENGDDGSETDPEGEDIEGEEPPIINAEGVVE